MAKDKYEKKQAVILSGWVDEKDDGSIYIAVEDEEYNLETIIRGLVGTHISLKSDLGLAVDDE